jgi:hypothetical protein
VIETEMAASGPAPLVEEAIETVDAPDLELGLAD